MNQLASEQNIICAEAFFYHKSWITSWIITGITNTGQKQQHRTASYCKIYSRKCIYYTSYQTPIRAEIMNMLVTVKNVVNATDIQWGGAHGGTDVRAKLAKFFTTSRVDSILSLVCSAAKWTSWFWMSQKQLANQPLTMSKVCLIYFGILANVNSRSRSLYVIVCLSVVCRL